MLAKLNHLWPFFAPDWLLACLHPPYSGMVQVEYTTCGGQINYSAFVRVIKWTEG